MDFNENVVFDKEKLFDFNTTESDLHEQLWAFIREGGTGTDLLILIRKNIRTGIADHVCRMLTLMSEKILVNKGEL